MEVSGEKRQVVRRVGESRTGESRAGESRTGESRLGVGGNRPGQGVKKSVGKKSGGKRERKGMSRACRVRLGEKFLECAKGTYTVLILGVLVIYFGKEGEMTGMEALGLMGLGVVLGTIFGYIGCSILNEVKEEV